jgi:hypothetical protein
MCNVLDAKKSSIPPFFVNLFLKRKMAHKKNKPYKKIEELY